MTLFDVAGLIGVLLMLSAYAAAQLRWLDATRATALLMNLVGAGLVLVSLTRAFNLSAALLESAWGLVALFGLVKLALKR